MTHGRLNIDSCPSSCETPTCTWREAGCYIILDPVAACPTHTYMGGDCLPAPLPLQHWEEEGLAPQPCLLYYTLCPCLLLPAWWYFIYCITEILCILLPCCISLCIAIYFITYLLWRKEEEERGRDQEEEFPLHTCGEAPTATCILEEDAMVTFNHAPPLCHPLPTPTSPLPMPAYLPYCEGRRAIHTPLPVCPLDWTGGTFPSPPPALARHSPCLCGHLPLCHACPLPTCVLFPACVIACLLPIWEEEFLPKVDQGGGHGWF